MTIGEGGVRTPLIIDCLQYSNWSEKIFRQIHEAGVAAIHATIAYHETFREMVLNVEAWNRYFEDHADLIVQARTAEDIENAFAKGRTAIVFGFQTPSPIEADIGLVEICHTLGVRFMQLTYNNQSLLAAGCYETDDAGITRMGRQVIREMNRLGMVVDMSHSADRSTIEAAEISERPIAITHANPTWWHPALRNKSNDVIRAVTGAGGMLGFSLYPHHLKDKSDCTLQSFCEMIARTAEVVGVEHLGIGSDLCQDQPDSVVEWMRNGRWTRDRDFGEGSPTNAGFPPALPWFKDSRDLHTIARGLSEVGFAEREVEMIMGRNWLEFFRSSFRSTRSLASSEAPGAAELSHAR